MRVSRNIVFVMLEACSQMPSHQECSLYWIDIADLVNLKMFQRAIGPRNALDDKHVIGSHPGVAACEKLVSKYVLVPVSLFGQTSEDANLMCMCIVRNLAQEGWGQPRACSIGNLKSYTRSTSSPCLDGYSFTTTVWPSVKTREPL